MSFGSRIKKIRIDKGITLTEAAEKLGINKGSLSRYENDVVEPSLSMAVKLARFYGAGAELLM